MKQPWQQQQQQQQQRMKAGYAWQQQQEGREVPRPRGCLGRLTRAFVFLLFIAACVLIVYVALNFEGPSF